MSCAKKGFERFKQYFRKHFASLKSTWWGILWSRLNSSSLLSSPLTSRVDKKCWKVETIFYNKGFEKKVSKGWKLIFKKMFLILVWNMGCCFSARGKLLLPSSGWLEPRPKQKNRPKDRNPLSSIYFDTYVVFNGEMESKVGYPKLRKSIHVFYSTDVSVGSLLW